MSGSRVLEECTQDEGEAMRQLEARCVPLGSISALSWLDSVRPLIDATASAGMDSQARRERRLAEVWGRLTWASSRGRNR